jgi:hypothetical protein
MSADVRATVDEVLELTLALSATLTGESVELTALYGVDGVNTGADESGDALAFPVSMSEGADGVYSTDVVLASEGVYFAKFELNSVHVTTQVVRVFASGHPIADGIADTGNTIATVTRDGTTAVSLTITDGEGAPAGQDSNGDDLSAMLAMTVVPGHADSWYYEEVFFSERDTFTLSMAGVSGPIWNDLFTVWGATQAAASHFNGWQPDTAYTASTWISVGYIRRWTGWSIHEVSSSVVRELRALAIETFITETNRWYPAWTGTWYGLRAQGRRLYLPLPVMLAQDGAAADPVITMHERHGDQVAVEIVPSSDVIWLTRGRHSKQPCIELNSRSWRPEFDVKITGTFGEVLPNNRRVPLAVKQVIVGLIRWHSLSFGQGPDGARDQATANRVRGENTRDYSANYHELAIGRGLTGDPTIDLALARMRIDPGPWASRANT